MLVETEYSRVIADADNRTLIPIGFKGRERSSLYVADNGDWLCLVEFPPGGFKRGTYLNIGTHWLWHPLSDDSFDYGGRIGGFLPFESDEQFAR